MRCEKCQGFVNLYFKISEDRQRMTCNLCETEMAVPEYYQNKDTDYSNTQFGPVSFELIANSQYNSKPPKEPTYYFIIDVGPWSCQKMIPFYALNVIKETLSSCSLNGKGSFSFGIALVDSSIHFVRITDNKIKLMTQSLDKHSRNIFPKVLSQERVPVLLR